MRVRGWISALAVTAMCMPAVAEEATSKTYVGRLAGAPASVRVGVVCDDAKFVAYICSANDEFNQKWSHWFKGDLKDGAFSAEHNGVTLAGKIGPAGLEGTFGADKPATFSANLVDNDGLAGLYRAAHEEDGDTIVTGWVVDENEQIVGAARGNRGGRAATQRPTGAEPSARTGKGGNVAGQRVVDPANPPDGKLLKGISPEDRRELLAGIAKRAAARGGNPLLGAVVQQAKRFVEGKQPSGAIEKKAFAALKGVSKSVLKNYTKNWDALPANTRDAIAGAFSRIGPDRALTPALAKQALGLLNANAEVAPPPAEGLFGLARDPFAGSLAVMLQDKAKKAGASVKSARIGTIRCVDPTGFFAGKKNADEIFMTAVVTSGAEAFDVKSSVYKFAKGQSKPFSAADGRLWPPPGKEDATEEDVAVAFGLFEDDSEDLKKIPALIKTLTKTGAGVAGIVLGDSPTGAIVTKAAELSEGLIDGIAAALPETAFLGSESIVIGADGKIRDAGGKSKSSVTFREVRRNGNVKFHYELKDFSVK